MAVATHRGGIQTFPLFPLSNFPFPCLRTPAQPQHQKQKVSDGDATQTSTRALLPMKRSCCVPIVLEHPLDSGLILSWGRLRRLQLPVLARSSQTILNGASQMRFTKLCIPPCALSVGRVSAPDSRKSAPYSYWQAEADIVQ